MWDFFLLEIYWLSTKRPSLFFINFIAALSRLSTKLVLYTNLFACSIETPVSFIITSICFSFLFALSHPMPAKCIKDNVTPWAKRSSKGISVWPISDIYAPAIPIINVSPVIKAGSDFIPNKPLDRRTLVLSVPRPVNNPAVTASACKASQRCSRGLLGFMWVCPYKENVAKFLTPISKALAVFILPL